MNADKVRTFHRWTSIVFTATVIAAFFGSVGEPVAWLYYLPLLPLLLLMVSGLTMFVRHVRGRRVVGGE